MTIYLNLYILFYLLTLIKLNYLLISYSTTFFNNSLQYIFYFLLKYNKLKSIILLLFLSLSGLPPFILFFIKFNYLINLLNYTNFIIIITVFIIFFLNMLFYIQIFFFKNININIVVKKNKNVFLNFFNLYYIVFYLFLIFFSIFFFTDIYYIVTLIYGNI